MIKHEGDENERRSNGEMMTRYQDVKGNPMREAHVSRRKERANRCQCEVDMTSKEVDMTLV